MHKPDLSLFSSSDIHLDGFLLKEFQEGVLRLNISARQADYFDNQSLLKLEDIQGIIRDSSGRVVSFQGGVGHVNSKTRNFFIGKSDTDVQIHLGNGLTLKASSLIWKDDVGKLVSSDPVQISGKGFVIDGNGFSFALEKQELYLDKNVHLSLGP